jgi:hypothetical protein
MFRVPPKMDAAAYQTYAVAMPRATHLRPATCAEVGCEAQLRGWRTIVDASGPAARYIRDDSGRVFDEPEPGTFIFEAGQRCFAQHETPVGRPEVYLVRDGDHRGNPRGTAPLILTSESWVDHFATHQDRLATAIQRG